VIVERHIIERTKISFTESERDKVWHELLQDPTRVFIVDELVKPRFDHGVAYIITEREINGRVK
jgi:hypothetical protein